MHCTRCGNPISSHSNVCPICQYVLTEDEYKEGIEEERKAKHPNKKEKPKKEPKPVKVKVVNPKITESNASEVTIINDSTRTHTNTGAVSPIRFLGYLLFLVSDASLVYGLWYLWFSTTFIHVLLGIAFALIAIILSFISIMIVRSAGVNAEFIKKNSINTAILGLLVSLAAFILLLVEMSHNNSTLIFIAIGLFISGAAAFIISISSREIDNKNKK